MTTRTLFILTAALLLAAMAAPVAAQLMSQIGNETTAPSATSSTPIYRSSASSSFDYSIQQTLYPASILGIPAGAEIVKIEYHKTDTFGSVANEHTLQVWLNETTATSYVNDTFGNATTGATLMFDSTTYGIPATSGWIDFGPFNQATPFVYNGGNLEVTVNWDCSITASSPTTGGFSWSYEAYGGGLGRGYSSSAAPTAATTLSTGTNNGNTRYPVVRVYWLPPTGDVNVLQNNSPPGDVLPASATDLVIMDVAAQTFNTSQDLNSITFTASGHFQDANLSNVKLVLDNNDDGAVDAGDTVLGQGTLASGQITFSGAPLVAVPTSGGPRLLLAVSYSAGVMGSGYSIAFEIAQSTDVVWSGGNDLGNYPMPSGNWVVPGVNSTFGNIHGNNTIPFNQVSSRYQTSYASSELGWPAGTVLNEIWVCGTIVTPPEYGNLHLRLGYTSLAPNAMTGTFDSNYNVGSQTTVLGPVNYIPTTVAIPGATVQWYVFTFSTPFVYNGTDNLLVDWIFDSRSTTGFNISSSVAPPGELTRGRYYANGTSYMNPTGSASSTGGNWGINFVASVPNSVNLKLNSTGAGLNTPEQDRVVLDFNAVAIGTPRTLDSLTFTSHGTAPDSSISDIKLVLDDNDDGVVDASDTLLGSGVLNNGQITFALSPGLPVPDATTASPPRLLLAVTIPGTLGVGQSVELRIDFVPDLVWSGGDDFTEFPFTGGPAAQLMSGVVSVANGNPGNAYDFGDLGDALDALETLGMSGPVILELYDVGGPFTPTDSYRLGVDGSSNTSIPVPGLSAANPLVIRAAPGNSPVIEGSGAVNTYSGTQSGCMAFRDIGNITIEGITFRGATDFGVMWYSTVQGSSDELVIRGCKFHDISAGSAIFLYGSTATNGASNVLIENNMIWDVNGDTSWTGGGQMGVIGGRRLGTDNIVRHNTIVLNSAGPTASVFFSNGSNGPMADVSYNIVYVEGTGTFYRMDASAVLPTTADYNVVFLGTTATMSSDVAIATWGDWQTAGYDANGLNADPLLQNVSVGNEDLHLQATSPAIDMAVGSTTERDVNGNLRPFGAERDVGAHEFGDPADMTVEFNSLPVTLNGVTNVGDARHTAGDTFTFTIGNAGLSDLLLTGTPPVTFMLGDNLEVTTDVQTQPATTTIAPSSNTTFTLYIEPTTVGPFNLVVEIPNGDGSKNPFRFTIEGMGIIPNAPAIADAPGNSLFSAVAVNGPFDLAIDPGDTLVDAIIELTDPDSDDIEVTSVVQTQGGTLAGVTVPTTSGLAAPPVFLEWTGAPDAANDPGDYVWEIEFVDAVNGTPVLITATIHINDLAPDHAIADADSGDGTAGNPYATTFVAGDDTSVSVDLVEVTDPNTSQALSITGVSPGTAPFDFTLAGGFLTLSPAATLTSADAGLHQYTVTVTDGTNLTPFEVEVLVYDASGAITFTTPTVLPGGIINQPYAGLIEVTGATGAVTFQLVGGSLPNGLTFNGATGAISGTPLTEETATFTIRAFDAANDTATETFELTIGPVPPPPSGTSSSGSSGCAGANGSNVALLALLAAIATLGLAVRSRRRHA